LILETQVEPHHRALRNATRFREVCCNQSYMKKSELEISSFRKSHIRVPWIRASERTETLTNKAKNLLILEISVSILKIHCPAALRHVLRFQKLSGKPAAAASKTRADGSRSALAAPTARGNESRRQLHKSLFEAQSNCCFWLKPNYSEESQSIF